MVAEFVIPGSPQGKARPRVTSHGTYTPKKTKDYERKVCFEYQRQSSAWFGESALAVHIAAYLPIPQSKPKTIRAKMLSGEIRPTIKADADNLAKSVLDALNGVAYKDDSQVVSLFVEKWYNPEPAVIVKIQEAV